MATKYKHEMEKGREEKGLSGKWKGQKEKGRSVSVTRGWGDEEEVLERVHKKERWW